MFSVVAIGVSELVDLGLKPLQGSGSCLYERSDEFRMLLTLDSSSLRSSE